MSSKSTVILQARDRQLLTAFDLSPFDARQLLLLSQTFAQPFPSDKAIRNRLLRLQAAGLVEHYHYQTESVGQQKYYKLTRDGFRAVHGPHKPLPSRSYFRPVSPSLQRHTRSLADFIVKTLTAAHTQRVQTLSFYGENQLILSMGEESLRLDAAAQLKARGYKPRNCLFELDCGTEPVYSTKKRESLSQKVRFILDYERACAQDFRHFTVFATTSPRLCNYLDVVNRLHTDPRRSICHAVLLEDYLAASDPFRDAIFLNRELRLTSIFPSRQQEILAPVTFRKTLDQQLVLC